MERGYRTKMVQERFRHFTIQYKETDLWIGVDPESYDNALEDFVLERVRYLRTEIEDYAKRDKRFFFALSPYFTRLTPGPAVEHLFHCAERAGVGPMAGVAGLFAQDIGVAIEKEFGVDEIVIENGGDVYLNLKREAIISIYAGDSPLSEKVGLKIEPEDTPLGICTSSGTVGHSLSFGQADAVVIVCKDACLADTYATAFANQIQEGADIYPVLQKISSVFDILGAVVIVGDGLGIRGRFCLVPLE